MTNNLTHARLLNGLGLLLNSLVDLIKWFIVLLFFNNLKIIFPFFPIIIYHSKVKHHMV